MRIAYVDGRYVPMSQAMVSMNDRGYHFADGVYEAMATINGVLIDGEAHLKRLERSLNELEIPMPLSLAALKIKIAELTRLNRVTRGVVYLQITRGVTTRGHVYPAGLKPVLTMLMAKAAFRSDKDRSDGIEVITIEDQRWARCDIKTIALLPNMLGRVEAARAGCKEAWQLRGDIVTEGTLSNAYIITKDGVIHTHPADHHILGGVRRQRTLEIARALQMQVVEKPFTLKDVAEASEAFISSCSNFITPVVTIDGANIGSGKPGPVTQRLMDEFDRFVETTIKEQTHASQTRRIII